MSAKLGLIVEGHNETICLPLFIQKIIGYYPNSITYPISNAKGIGNIWKNLDNELLYIIKSHKPENILVLLDYKELLKEGFVTNCSEIITTLNAKSEEWLKNQREHGSLTPLPNRVIPVVMLQSFDTWLISDLEGLKQSEIMDENLITEIFTDVDTEIPSPASWLKTKAKIKCDLKNKRNVIQIAKEIDPNVGKDFSRSLRKFHKEIYNNSIILNPNT